MSVEELPLRRSPASLAPATHILALLLAGRLMVWLCAYLGLALLDGPPKPGNVFPGNLFLDGWTRWDAGWYARIAADGYTNAPLPGSRQTDVAFFPLYPILMRGVAAALGDVYVAGILIANAAYVVAGLLLHRLVAARLDDETGTRAVLLLAAQPYGWAFSAVYAESLLLCGWCAAMLLATRGHWVWAGIAAAAATATKPSGVAIVPALLLLAWAQSGWNCRRTLRPAGAALIGLAGIGAYAAFLWVRFGSPWVYFDAQRGWAEQHSLAALRALVTSVSDAGFGAVASGNIPILPLAQLVWGLITVAALLLAWRRLPGAWSLLAWLALALAAMRWESYGRLMAPAFPVVVALASLRWRGDAFALLVASMSMLLGVLTICYAHLVWVG